MNHPVQAEIIGCIRLVVESMRSFADAQSVALSFTAREPVLIAHYSPEDIVPDLIHLVCRIVTFTPQHQSVAVHSELIDSPEKYFIKLRIENSGVNLSRIGEITARLKNTCNIQADFEDKTVYELIWPLQRPAVIVPPPALETIHPPESVRRFYDAVRKRMNQHFNKKESLYDVLLKSNPADAIFYKKVNAIIQSHLDDELFDTEYLAKALAMSRMHLHRKLKPMVGKSPANYIRHLRLDKAKELIETTNLTIGEVMFRVGFISQSHFTRAFITRFGVRPTAFKRRH